MGKPTRTPREKLDETLDYYGGHRHTKEIDEAVGYTAMAEALKRTLAYLYTTDDYKLGRVSEAILGPDRAALEIVYGPVKP